MVDLTPKRTGPMRLDRRRAAMMHPRLRRRQRLVLAAIGFAVSAIGAIFLAGYVIAFVMPPRALVVRVDNVEYTRGDLVELVRIRQKSVEFLGETFDASSGVFEALQLMVENEIISQVAPSMGITVSEMEIDSHIEAIMRPNDYEILGKSEDQISRETHERYNSYLNTIQIDEKTHRHIVRSTTLRQKFREYIGDSVPFVAEQVHLFRIMIPVGGEIDIMNIKYQDAVRDIEDPIGLQMAYLEIVREFSIDLPETIRHGGEIGWIARDVIPDYEYMFFDLEPGEMSDPINNLEDTNQIFFFMISERHKARELSPAVREQLKTKALQEWVNKERKSHDVYAVFNSDIYGWVFEQLRLSSVAATPTPDPFQGILSGM